MPSRCSECANNFIKVIKPAFGKVADGTSNSGTPKAPISKTLHPDFEIEDAFMKSEEHQKPPSENALLNWNHACYLGPVGPTMPRPLAADKWFTEQPLWKSLFDQAAAIKEGKLAKMNKAGKAEVAKQLMDAADAAAKRWSEKEGPLLVALNAQEDQMLPQLEKVRREEAAAAGGGCCTIL